MSPIRSPPRCWTFFKERNTEAEPLRFPSEPLSASVNMIWRSVVIFLSAATMCLGRGGGALSRFFLALQRYGHPGFSQLHNFRHKTFHPHRLMSVSDSQPPPSSTTSSSSSFSSMNYSAAFCALVLFSFHILCRCRLDFTPLSFLGSPAAAAVCQTQPTAARKEGAGERYPKYIAANKQNIQCNMLCN